MKEKHFYRFIALFVGVLLGVSFLFPHHPALLNRAEFNPSTTSQTALHFKNIRSYWYDPEEIEGQGATHYTYKKWDENLSAGLRPSIVHQWRQDEATLILTPFKGESDTLELQLVLGADTLDVSRSKLNREGIIDVADRWMRHLDTAQTYTLIDPSFGEIELSESEISGVQTVLTDYFTLVGYLR